ncbi:hypothetical protein [Chitinophaga parva]|uniref:hypothetical protein n=1 Tax=Chitinophaga parva TaxID=2169414 RepID=UPI001403A2BA|nr:hypothetical protein [Chitinophaga parva]
MSTNLLIMEHGLRAAIRYAYACQGATLAGVRVKISPRAGLKKRPGKKKINGDECRNN